MMIGMIASRGDHGKEAQESWGVWNPSDKQYSVDASRSRRVCAAPRKETHMLIMTLGLSTSPPPRVDGVDPRAS